MSIYVFERSVELPVPASDAFAWHERSGAFDRLSPPWMRVKVSAIAARSTTATRPRSGCGSACCRSLGN